MAEPAATARRRRRWPWLLLVLVVFGLAAALALHRYSRPQRLDDLLASQVRQQLGAELVLDGAAGFQLTPGLQALLPKPQLVVGGKTVLRADAIAASVPWRTLWGDHYEIERIELQRPLLDLDALRAWLATRPSSDAPIPDVRFALRVVDGTILASGRPLARDIDIDFANSGDLAAWLASLERDASEVAPLPPGRGTVSAASVQIGETRLEGVRIQLRDDAAPARE
jgi:hypothetical protein